MNEKTKVLASRIPVSLTDGKSNKAVNHALYKMFERMVSENEIDISTYPANLVAIINSWEMKT